MTRLAFDLGGWTDQPFTGTAVLTPAEITANAPTFASARLWDPRPLQTSLDQLQTVRKYYDFTDVDTDRYTIDDVQRQVMLSARELALEQNPHGDRLGQPADHLHARRRGRDGAGQRGRQPGPAEPPHRQPAAGLGRRRADDHPAADLLRGTAVVLHRHRRAGGRVRLSDRRQRHRRVGRRPDALDRHDRGQARQHADAAPVRRPLPRPRPAHQRPGDGRQPAPLPPVASPTGSG